MANITICTRCDKRIDTKTEAYGLKEPSGAALCIDCCDHSYSVTLVDSGEVIPGVSTWERY